MLKFYLVARRSATSEGMLYRSCSGFFRTDVPSSQYTLIKVTRWPSLVIRMSFLLMQSCTTFFLLSILCLSAGRLEEAAHSSRQSVLIPPGSLLRVRTLAMIQYRMHRIVVSLPRFGGSRSLVQAVKCDSGSPVVSTNVADRGIRS